MKTSKSHLPVNLDILTVRPEDLVKLGRVKELQIFGQGSNFHPEGLFSVQLFGAVGSEVRMTTYGYIDIHHGLLHPAVYKSLVGIKGYYKQILDGSVTAIWDNKSKTFVKSHEEGASTGYTFFMSKLAEMKFERSASDQRNFSIELVEQSIRRNEHLLRYLLVMPAGMRDYVITPSGKPEEDEVNSLYRRVLAQSQLVDPLIAKKTPEVYDNIYVNIQKALVELYDYFMSLFDGKNKLILGKWLGRKIFNSTRNVLTAPVDRSTKIDDKNRLLSNQVGIGLYQFLRAAAPKTLYYIRSKYMKDKVFFENNNLAYLINAKTMQREEVISAHVQKDYDQWMTVDGLETVIANYGNIDTRHLPVTAGKGKYYVALIYNDGRYVKVFQDLKELPEQFDRGFVSPITMSELLYLSVADMSDEIPAVVTRYPINGYGGIYPAFMKIRTTGNYGHRIELDDHWNPSKRELPSFPIRGDNFLNGMTVHQSHMALLGGDFDGDTMSVVGVLSDEGIAEIRRVLSSKNYYLNDERKIIFSDSTDVLNAVLSFLTKPL